MTAFGALLSNHSVLQGWELLGEERVTGSAVTDVTFSGIDGDNDEHYMLLGYIFNDAGGFANFELRPNNLTSNLSSRRITAVDGDSLSTDAVTYIRLSGILTDAHNCIQMAIHAETGFPRIFTGTSTESGAATPQLEINGGIWDEINTNMTSLVIHCQTALGIGVGSIFKLYRQKAAFSTE